MPPNEFSSEQVLLSGEFIKKMWVPKLFQIWGLGMQDCGPKLPASETGVLAKSDTTITAKHLHRALPSNQAPVTKRKAIEWDPCWRRVAEGQGRSHVKRSCHN